MHHLGWLSVVISFKQCTFSAPSIPRSIGGFAESKPQPYEIFCFLIQTLDLLDAVILNFLANKKKPCI